MPQSIYDNGGMIGVTLDFGDTDTYGGSSVTYPAGEAEYTTPGTYSWTAPEGITSVSAVAVGGGGGGLNSTSGGSGGGGGGLAWRNDITVVPGNSYSVIVGAGGDEDDGGDSYFISTLTVRGQGGEQGNTGVADGGTYVGDGGGNGGDSGNGGSYSGGGGGAGGYTGNGGNGGPGTYDDGLPGSGGGGGGGGNSGSNDASGAGGGVGIYGEGVSGSGGAGSTGNAQPGTGGSGGQNGSASPGSTARPSTGGDFGGGGGGADGINGEQGPGGGGAVRIIWGSNRAFPSTNTADGQGDDIVVGSDTRDEVIPVLEDNLEVFSGWSDFGSGTFTQSSTRSFNGTYSGLRDTAAHGNGGVKLLSEPISRPYRMEMRIWTDDSIRGTTNADRIGVLNSSLEGYGPRVDADNIGTETYNGAYNSNATISTSAFSKPQSQWYKMVFEANADDTFTTTTYLEDGTLVGSHTTAPDTTYTGTFDRIAIGGGYPYYVDDISIYGTATKPLNKKNSGIWSLASVLEGIDLIPAGPSSTSISYIGNYLDPASLSSYTFSGLSIGPGLAVLSIHNETGNPNPPASIIGVSINGVSAAPAVNVGSDPPGATNSSIWYAELSTTATTVSVNYDPSASPVRMSLGIHVITGYSNAYPTFTGADYGNDFPTQREVTTASLPSGSSIVAAHTSGNVYSHSWSGVTERYDDSFTGIGSGVTGASIVTGSSGQTLVGVTLGATPTQSSTLVVAAWS